MKNREQILMEHFKDLPTLDLTLYLELGDSAERSGDRETSIYWYKNGYEKAKQLKDRSRIQQFSNILCTIL